MLKPSTITEPAIKMKSGEMGIRTTINCLVESTEGIADFLTDVLNEYKGKNIQIEINETE